MTSKQLYENVQIELNKENAPNVLLEDFNYFANKAINQYVNKRYNIYDVNQQTTDDLRVLKATAMLTPQRLNDYNDLSLAKMATYYVDLPSDYLHLLNCICIYKVKKTYKCYNKDDTWRAAATRLTADAYSQVLDNFWLKPTYKRPYYYIHNINTSETVPTNPYGGNFYTDPGDPDVTTPSSEQELPTRLLLRGSSTAVQNDSTSKNVISKSAAGSIAGATSIADEIEGQSILKTTFDDLMEKDSIKLRVDSTVIKFSPYLSDYDEYRTDETKRNQFDVKVESSIGTWQASTTADWLTLEKVTKADGTYLRIKVIEPNETNNVRYAPIKITSGQASIGTTVIQDKVDGSIRPIIDTGTAPIEHEHDVIDLQPSGTGTGTVVDDGTTNTNIPLPSGEEPETSTICIYPGTDPIISVDTNDYGTDAHGRRIVQGAKIHTNVAGTDYSNIERGQGIRYGNVSKVRLEIRYGTDTSVFSLDEGKIYIDYIKAPQFIRLTQQELDFTEDYSQVLEFPDYVCQEILNELVHIIMENISDQRLQTHPVVSQSIANPAQAQAPQAEQGKSA